jgi:hypothetical protein
MHCSWYRTSTSASPPTARPSLNHSGTRHLDDDADRRPHQPKPPYPRLPSRHELDAPGERTLAQRIVLTPERSILKSAHATADYRLCGLVPCAATPIRYSPRLADHLDGDAGCPFDGYRGHASRLWWLARRSARHLGRRLGAVVCAPPISALSSSSGVNSGTLAQASIRPDLVDIRVGSADEAPKCSWSRAAVYGVITVPVLPDASRLSRVCGFPRFRSAAAVEARSSGT